MLKNLISMSQPKFINLLKDWMCCRQSFLHGIGMIYYRHIYIVLRSLTHDGFPCTAPHHSECSFEVHILCGCLNMLLKKYTWWYQNGQAVVVRLDGWGWTHFSNITISSFVRFLKLLDRLKLIKPSLLFKKTMLSGKVMRSYSLKPLIWLWINECNVTCFDC